MSRPPPVNLYVTPAPFPSWVLAVHQAMQCQPIATAAALVVAVGNGVQLSAEFGIVEFEGGTAF